MSNIKSKRVPKNWMNSLHSALPPDFKGMFSWIPLNCVEEKKKENEENPSWSTSPLFRRHTTVERKNSAPPSLNDRTMSKISAANDFLHILCTWVRRSPGVKIGSGSAWGRGGGHESLHIIFVDEVAFWISNKGTPTPGVSSLSCHRQKHV